MSRFQLFLTLMAVVSNVNAASHSGFEHAVLSYLPVRIVTVDKQQAQDYGSKEGERILIAKTESEIRKHIKSWNLGSDFSYIREIKLGNGAANDLASMGIFLFEIRNDNRCHACSPEAWILDSRTPTPSITKVSLAGKWGMIDKNIKIKRTKDGIYLAQIGGDMHQGYISTYMYLERYSLRHRTSRVLYEKSYRRDNPIGTAEGHATWNLHVDFGDDVIKILTLANMRSCGEQNILKKIISAISNSCTNNSVSEFEELIFYEND